MTYSCSATMTLYTTEQCMSRLENWYHWHQHWVYGATPPLKLPDAMPLNQPRVRGVPPSQSNGGSRDIAISHFQDDYGYMGLFDTCVASTDEEGGVEMPDDSEAGADDGGSITEDFPETESETSELSSDTEPFHGE